MRNRSRHLAVVVALLASCGGEQTSEGAAGAPAAPLGIGEACADTGQCRSGMICSRTVFSGQCTTSCPSDASCLTVQAATRCFGAPQGECGLPCGTGMPTECPAGTVCVPVAGAMACKAQ